MHVQVPWGMVTGPDGNLYVAMDDEFEVHISLTASCTVLLFRYNTLRSNRYGYLAAGAKSSPEIVESMFHDVRPYSARHA